AMVEWVTDTHPMKAAEMQPQTPLRPHARLLRTSLYFIEKTSPLANTPPPLDTVAASSATARPPDTRLLASETPSAANTPPPREGTPAAVDTAVQSRTTTPCAALAGSNGLPRLTLPLEKMQPPSVPLSVAAGATTPPETVNPSRSR